MRLRPTAELLPVTTTSLSAVAAIESVCPAAVAAASRHTGTERYTFAFIRILNKLLIFSAKLRKKSESAATNITLILTYNPDSGLDIADEVFKILGSRFRQIVYGKHAGHILLVAADVEVAQAYAHVDEAEIAGLVVEVHLISVHKCAPGL